MPNRITQFEEGKERMKALEEEIKIYEAHRRDETSLRRLSRI
jgi:hypothetical protein